MKLVANNSVTAKSFKKTNSSKELSNFPRDCHLKYIIALKRHLKYVDFTLRSNYTNVIDNSEQILLFH